MVKNSNQHIYLGIGTLSVFLLGAFVIYRSAKSKKKRQLFSGNPTMDLSVFDSPDIPGSGNCMDRRLLFMIQQLEAHTGYPIFILNSVLTLHLSKNSVVPGELEAFGELRENIGRERAIDRALAESAEGANGDVVPVTLWLHSNFENPGWVSLAVSVCHNPDAVEIVGLGIDGGLAALGELDVDALRVGAEALVDPEVAPVVRADGVAPPLVGRLV